MIYDTVFVFFCLIYFPYVIFSCGCSGQEFLFMAKQYSIVCVCVCVCVCIHTHYIHIHISFVHSSISGYLGVQYSISDRGMATSQDQLPPNS